MLVTKQQLEEFRFQEFRIPEHMHEGVMDYVNEGIEPGSFLSAVIANDLKEAVGCADFENMRNLPAYVAFFYNHAPAVCWGSRAKMEAWMKQRREKYA